MRMKNAFTLVEVLVVVLMLGAVAAIAVPRLSVGVLHRGKVEIEARKIVAALRLARQLAITNAATNPQGFELVMIGQPSYTRYELVDLKGKKVVTSGTIDPAVTCTGDSRFCFRPLGNLRDANSNMLTLSADGKTVTITIVRATGMVKCD